MIRDATADLCEHFIIIVDNIYTYIFYKIKSIGICTHLLYYSLINTSQAVASLIFKATTKNAYKNWF